MMQLGKEKSDCLKSDVEPLLADGDVCPAINMITENLQSETQIGPKELAQIMMLALREDAVTFKHLKYLAINAVTEGSVSLEYAFQALGYLQLQLMASQVASTFEEKQMG